MIVPCASFDGLVVIGFWLATVLTADLAIRLVDRLKSIRSNHDNNPDIQ